MRGGWRFPSGNRPQKVQNHVKDMKGIRRLLVIAGMILLVPALLWLIAGLAGLVPTDAAAIAGTSGLRIIGSVAVAGCLMAAIGSWDE